MLFGLWLVKPVALDLHQEQPYTMTDPEQPSMLLMESFQDGVVKVWDGELQCQDVLQALCLVSLGFGDSLRRRGVCGVLSFAW